MVTPRVRQGAQSFFRGTDDGGNGGGFQASGTITWPTNGST